MTNTQHFYDISGKRFGAMNQNVMPQGGLAAFNNMQEKRDYEDFVNDVGIAEQEEDDDHQSMSFDEG